MRDSDKVFLKRVSDMIWRQGRRDGSHKEQVDLLIEQVELMVKVAYMAGSKNNK